jgi:signal transduction histidine kinase
LPAQGLLETLSRFLPNSLATRAIILSTLWAALSLVIIAGFITTLYRDAAEKNFSSLLSAHLFNLIAATNIDKNGRLQGAPELGDLRYSAPKSGWYWTIEPASEAVSGELKSSSISGGIVVSPDTKTVPFDSAFRRKFQTSGLDGETVEVFETEVAMSGDDKIARFRVMGNRNEFDAEITEFSWTLYRYLMIFGLGSIAVNALAIMAGLHPLKRVIGALAQIREGKAQHLDGVFPQEIEPLANEMNALIDNNRRIVERSRTQVGNLAHSLKTPLSVVINEGRALGGNQGKLISEQADGMQAQIQHYLQRARVAAQRDSVVFRTPIEPVIERMLRVMRKLSTHIEFVQIGDAKAIVFAGEAEDFEEILGNLLENASKWGKARVEIQTTSSEGRFHLRISDDGPGLTGEQMQDALKRGKRIDESKPGTGLGLSIVSDTVHEYGGELKLSRGVMGGLEVSMILPCAQK